MNWIDFLIIIVLIGYAIYGFSRGLLRALLELLGFTITFIIAIFFYGAVGQILVNLFSMPQSFSNTIGFFIIMLVGQVIYFLIVRAIYPKVPISWTDSKINRYSGSVPATLNGLIIAGIVLSLVISLPVAPKLKEDVLNAKIGGWLVKRASFVENKLASVFGGAVSDTLNFLTVQPNTDETIDLGFHPENLTIDEDSERKMLELLNNERLSRGLRPLEVDAQIREVARAHSRDMFERDYFAHENPDGKSPFDRMKEGGIEFLTAGENLALAPDVELAHDGLMNSEGHRENILYPYFKRIGIGVIDGGIYGKMFTQNFAD